MLKLIAVITMVMDHVGYLFFPEQEWLRAVGRLSMPIFAYAIARGFFFTSSPNSYVKRVAILAVASQIPFTLLSGSVESYHLGEINFWLPTLNMVVPWALALLLLRAPFLAVVASMAALLLVPMDYTALVILLPIFIYQYWFKTKQPALAALSVIGVLALIALASSPLQWWSMAVIPLIVLLEPYDGRIRLNRWFFYLFYPLHIVLLLIIAYLTGAPGLPDSSWLTAVFSS